MLNAKLRAKMKELRLPLEEPYRRKPPLLTVRLDDRLPEPSIWGLSGE